MKRIHFLNNFSKIPWCADLKARQNIMKWIESITENNIALSLFFNFNFTYTFIVAFQKGTRFSLIIFRHFEWQATNWQIFEFGIWKHTQSKNLSSIPEECIYKYLSQTFFYTLMKLLSNRWNSLKALITHWSN